MDVALAKEGEDVELLKEAKFEERKEEWRQKVKANQPRDAEGGQKPEEQERRRIMDSGTLDDIIARLLDVRSAKPGKQVQLSEAEIRQLCLISKDLFLAQPNLLELEAPIKICGIYLPMMFLTSFVVFVYFFPLLLCCSQSNLISQLRACFFPCAEKHGIAGHLR